MPRTERRGVALFSYLTAPLTTDYRRDPLPGHSNRWESREIARLLVELGYVVDAVEWTDPIPRQGGYDLIFDIYANLARTVQGSPDGLRLLHLTGSYGPWHNEAERHRCAEFNRTHGASCRPARQVEDIAAYERSLLLANRCSLLGNAWTLGTFPERLRDRIHTLAVSASWLPWRKRRKHLVPPEREFLWFFGSGAIHKGLDLALDAFLGAPHLRLNVVGNIEGDAELLQVYGDALARARNISIHGMLDPAGPAFREVVKRCFAFIAPSCSESMSAAVATCLQIGLYPIVSRETGITLQKAGGGAYLGALSAKHVLAAAEVARTLDERQLADEIESLQRDALRRYSRSAFTHAMRAFLREATEDKA